MNKTYLTKKECLTLLAEAGVSKLPRKNQIVVIVPSILSMKIGTAKLMKIAKDENGYYSENYS